MPDQVIHPKACDAPDITPTKAVPKALPNHRPIGLGVWVLPLVLVGLGLWGLIAYAIFW